MYIDVSVTGLEAFMGLLLYILYLAQCIFTAYISLTKCVPRLCNYNWMRCRLVE